MLHDNLCSPILNNRFLLIHHRRRLIINNRTECKHLEVGYKFKFPTKYKVKQMYTLILLHTSLNRLNNTTFALFRMYLISYNYLVNFNSIVKC